MVVRFLSQAEPAMLGEFQKILDFADMQATGLKRETTFGPVATMTCKRKSQERPFSHFPPPPMTAKSDNSIPLKQLRCCSPAIGLQSYESRSRLLCQ